MRKQSIAPDGFFINLPMGNALVLGARRLLVETPLFTGRFDGVAAMRSTLTLEGARLPEAV